MKANHVTGSRKDRVLLVVVALPALLHRPVEQNPWWRHAREANASGRPYQLPMAKRTDARGE
jgi:hypothetical protein